MRSIFPLVLLAVSSTPAVAASKWAGKNADVVAVRVLPVDQTVLYTKVADMKTFEAMIPADCANDWDVQGEPKAGVGAHGSVRYDIGGMHRHLDFVVKSAESPRQVDIEHMGKKGFVTRLALRPATDGTELELHTYLNPPHWPFTGYFFKKVQPAWVDCYERALANLGATVP